MAKRFNNFNKFSKDFLYESYIGGNDYTIDELCNKGKNTTFTREFLVKESRIDESYKMILESEAMIESIEMHLASEMMRSEDYMNEGFKDFVKSVFGDKVVARVKSFPKNLYNYGSELLDKGKEVWDKTVSNLKEFMAKIKDVVKNIIDSMKNFLSALWDMIKGVAQKMGKFVFGKHADQLEKISKDMFEVNEAEEVGTEEVETKGGTKESKLKKEAENLKTDFQELKDKYFKKKEFKETEKMAIDAGENLDKEKEGEEPTKESIDSTVWNSFLGLYSVSESDVIKELETLNEEGHEKGEAGHGESSKVVKWIQSIVMWILSPIGAAWEFGVEIGTKAILAIPSAITRGIKNITKYTVFPALATLLAGIVADVFGIKKGLAHESTYIKQYNQLFESAFSNPEKLKAGVEKVSKAAVGAAAGYAVGIAMHAIPPLHVAFEFLALGILVMMFLGWLKDSHPKMDWISDDFVEFFHWIH